MAEVLSNYSTGSFTAPQQRVLRFLKTLPQAYRIWTHFHAGEMGAPDFLLMDPEGRALLVKVSLARPAAAYPAAQLPLIEDERPPLGQFETRVLEQFTQRLPRLSIALALVFPYIPQKQLNYSRPPGLSQQAAWLGRETLQEGGERQWVQAFDCPPLEKVAQMEARLRFSPETALPGALCSPDLNPVEGGCLLDPVQERTVKAGFDLRSPAPAGRLAVWMVSGPCGSGKTTALLYRMRLHYEIASRQRALVMAPAQNLVSDLQSRYERLAGRLTDKIEWNTLSAWCRANWPQQPPWIEPLAHERRQGFIRAVWHGLFKGSSLTDTELRQEFDWIKDQEKWSREVYLRAHRRPAGLAAQIYTGFERYSRILKEKRTLDWGDVPQQMLKFLDEGIVRPQPYDLILLDEAQFFSPLAFSLLRRLVKPDGELLLTVESRRGSTPRETPWKALGSQERIRAFHLDGSYGSDCPPVDPEILARRISDDERETL